MDARPIFGDVAGAVESPVYAIFQMNKKLQALDTREFALGWAALIVQPIRFRRFGTMTRGPALQ
jgi:hypothetical protein